MGSENQKFRPVVWTRAAMDKINFYNGQGIEIDPGDVARFYRLGTPIPVPKSETGNGKMMFLFGVELMAVGLAYTYSPEVVSNPCVYVPLAIVAGLGNAKILMDRSRHRREEKEKREQAADVICQVQGTMLGVSHISDLPSQEAVESLKERMGYYSKIKTHKA